MIFSALYRVLLILSLLGANPAFAYDGQAYLDKVLQTLDFDRKDLFVILGDNVAMVPVEQRAQLRQDVQVLQEANNEQIRSLGETTDDLAPGKALLAMSLDREVALVNAHMVLTPADLTKLFSNDDVRWHMEETMTRLYFGRVKSFLYEQKPQTKQDDESIRAQLDKICEPIFTSIKSYKSELQKRNDLDIASKQKLLEVKAWALYEEFMSTLNQDFPLVS